MKILCKHKKLDQWILGFNFAAAAAVIAIFVVLYIQSSPA